MIHALHASRENCEITVFRQNEKPCHPVTVVQTGQKQIFLTVNLKYEETECKIKIGGYLDLMRMVPIHFKKFHGIDFVVQVNNANVTEDTFGG
mmetsp:Transcript_4471/g.6313  ORF Transcript_4471/g.6313 Transcript_4471/m.6313 type:complete len:93 (+) Transcript_4471:45-323(+)